MGNPVYQTITTTGTATAVCMDWTLVPFNAAFAVELQGNTTASYKVEYTLDDLQNTNVTATWFASTDAPANTTGSKSGSFTSPITYCRVNCSTLSASGSLQFAVLQGIPV